MTFRRRYPEKAEAVDQLLATLSDRVRREIVAYFENRADDLIATLDEVVTHINGRIPGADGDRLTQQLLHIHLPKLRERGWLDYDRRTGDIRYYGHDSAERLLSDVRNLFDEP